MALVISDMSTSLDRYVTGRNDSPENPFGDDGGPVGNTSCFVVTHRLPTTSYPPISTFVTDGVLSAIEQAKNPVGEKVVVRSLRDGRSEAIGYPIRYARDSLAR